MKRIANLVRVVRRRVVVAVLFVGVAVAAAGCETSSTLSAGPDPVKCQVSLGTTAMVEAVGGPGTVAVTTQPECAWEASTTATWISALSPATGQGVGNVTFRVAPNEGTSARDGNIVVNGQQARVSQRAPCRYELTPASQSIATSGGESSVTIATSSECAWTATTDVNWISLTQPLSGSGDGVVSFSVVPNPGAARSGSISVAGQRATVTQGAAAALCSATISPASQTIGATGGPGGPIFISTPNTCAWTAVSNTSWIAVTSSAGGTGEGQVTFSVAANTGAARNGTLTIAARTFTVAQAAAGAPPPPPPACTYSIAPTSQNAEAAAGTGTVTVTAGIACIWTATSNAPWITITAGASGTGNGAVAFTIAANTGAARSGTLTIAGQVFTVNQAAAAPPPPACTYSIAPNSQNADAAAGTGAVTVTAGVGCIWTATSNAPWITITAGAAGTGNGAVAFTIAANTGAARSGTLTIAGQVFTVNQAAAAPPPPACTYAIAPANQNFTALGGSGNVGVTATGSNCNWTASSNAPWIGVTSGSPGSGNGTVGFSVAVNLGAARSGTLTVAGQVFTVTQNAVLGGLR